MMIQLRPMDIFFLDLPGDLSKKGFVNKIINWFQALWSRDHKSTTPHCGVITDWRGGTIETTDKFTSRLNIFDDHPGTQMQIFRWVHMTPDRAALGLAAAERQLGYVYPYHRWILFILRVAKRVHWFREVCSELVGHSLAASGAQERWWGLTVDQLKDWVVKLQGEFILIYDGRPIDMVRE